jgi:hypothetical protein
MYALSSFILPNQPNKRCLGPERHDIACDVRSTTEPIFALDHSHDWHRGLW